jgi:hypothetical protein
MTGSFVRQRSWGWSLCGHSCMPDVAGVHQLVSEGRLGHHHVGAVPPATSALGEERGVRGFVVMVGT